MNYAILIFIILFTLPFFTDIYGQKGSRDLNAEYCVTNWDIDPVRCAGYVPKDQNEKKSDPTYRNFDYKCEFFILPNIRLGFVDCDLISLSYTQLGLVVFGIFCFIMIMSGCVRYHDQFQHIRRGVKAKMVFNTIIFAGLFALGFQQMLSENPFLVLLGFFVTIIGICILLTTRYVKPIQRQV